MQLRAIPIPLVAMATAACEPAPGPFANDLPEGAHLLPAADAVYFSLTVVGDSDSRDVTVLNGGAQNAELHDVRIEGRDAEFFVIESIVPDFPNEKLVAPRAAAGIRVRFTPTRRRVGLASLVIESNANSGNPIEVELVGPGQVNPIPLKPDVAAFQGVVEIAERPGYDQPLALARYFNLGGQTLVASTYSLSDETRFHILPGTPVPGIPCDPLGACVPETGQAQGCCELACRGRCDGGTWAGQACACSLAMADAGSCTPPVEPCPGDTANDANVECLGISCEPVRLVSGDYAVVPIGFIDPAATGSYDLFVAIATNDPDHGTQTVTIRGSL